MLSEEYLINAALRGSYGDPIPFISENPETMPDMGQLTVVFVGDLMAVATWEGEDWIILSSGRRILRGLPVDKPLPISWFAVRTTNECD